MLTCIQTMAQIFLHAYMQCHSRQPHRIVSNEYKMIKIMHNDLAKMPYSQTSEQQSLYKAATSLMITVTQFKLQAAKLVPI